MRLTGLLLPLVLSCVVPTAHTFGHRCLAVTNSGDCNMVHECAWWNGACGCYDPASGKADSTSWHSQLAAGPMCLNGLPMNVWYGPYNHSANNTDICSNPSHRPIATALPSNNHCDKDSMSGVYRKYSCAGLPDYHSPAHVTYSDAACTNNLTTPSSTGLYTECSCTSIGNNIPSTECRRDGCQNSSELCSYSQEACTSGDNGEACAWVDNGCTCGTGRFRIATCYGGVSTDLVYQSYGSCSASSAADILLAIPRTGSYDRGSCRQKVLVLACTNRTRHRESALCFS